MPLRKHARTISIVRFLRAAGPLPRRRRIPAQRQPDLIRKGYYDALMPLIARQLKPMRDLIPEIVRLLADERAEQKMDSPRKDRAKQLVDRAASKAVDLFRPHEVEAVAEKFGKRTSQFQQQQLDAQVRAAFAVPLSTLEAPVQVKIDEFAATNVELVRSVSERYFDRIRLDVEDAFESGMTTADLAETLEGRFDMAEGDAMRIARDQIGKLNGEVNQERQESLGVETYVWRTAQDNRVRDNHGDLEGEECSWDDPPEGGGTSDDEAGHPGSGIQCRCYAEPNFGPILEDIEE